jgi:hypothetical protein
VDDLGKEGADHEGPRAVQVMKIMELTKSTESSGRRPWRWERGPPYMAAQSVGPQKVTGNAVLDHDFSGGRRSRQGKLLLLELLRNDLIVILQWTGTLYL